MYFYIIFSYRLAQNAIQNNLAKKSAPKNKRKSEGYKNETKKVKKLRLSLGNEGVRIQKGTAKGRTPKTPKLKSPKASKTPKVSPQGPPKRTLQYHSSHCLMCDTEIEMGQRHSLKKMVTDSLDIAQVMEVIP